MESWFLIYCKAQQESRAEVHLARQGFKVFRPTVNIARRRAGKSAQVKCEPLFPRYLFLQVDPERRSISPVANTCGVSNFVKFGDRYATASQSLIDQLKSHADNPIETPAFKQGDKVIVDGHGFNQVEAIYSSHCGDERAMILMKMLGNNARITVPLDCLSKA